MACGLPNTRELRKMWNFYYRQSERWYDHTGVQGFVPSIYTHPFPDICLRYSKLLRVNQRTHTHTHSLAEGQKIFSADHKTLCLEIQTACSRRPWGLLETMMCLTEGSEGVFPCFIVTDWCCSWWQTGEFIFRGKGSERNTIWKEEIRMTTTDFQATVGSFFLRFSFSSCSTINWSLTACIDCSSEAAPVPNTLATDYRTKRPWPLALASRNGVNRTFLSARRRNFNLARPTSTLVGGSMSTRHLWSAAMYWANSSHRSMWPCRGLNKLSVLSSSTQQFCTQRPWCSSFRGLTWNKVK